MEGFEVPPTHPRYESLKLRERLVKGFEVGLVVPQGLIAHGRGEAFDYLLGEKTHEFALRAIEAAVAGLIYHKPRSIISVNGNMAALAPDLLAQLSETLDIPLEVNLFYRTEERIRRIEEHLRAHGARRVLGSRCDSTRLPGLESPRGIVCKEGIYKASFVLVGVEDGDRTEALRRAGKVVAAVDLNPFSRTAQTANITVVDELTRALREALRVAERLSGSRLDELKAILDSYDNRVVLASAFKVILERLSDAAERGIIIEP